MTYEAIRACALAILAGSILQVDGVSAGRGIVVDWRTIKSGETLVQDANAFDTAQLFVALVGVERALSVVGDAPEATAFVTPAPRVAAYMANASGARRRSFEAGPFRVFVEPHDEDDAAQAEFTAQLARLAATIP